ncbi:MAG TPA: FAD-dependent oxidoreductase [Phycisphaerae bacterium]|nr:FAD-dependent oxidoreductase [Phycisphaerae bacterium]
MSRVTTDVVIVGGGVMGLSSAWRLALKGIKATIVEIGRCGEGSSRAALGALWPSPAVNAGPLQILHRKSLWGFQDFIKELYEASGLPVDYLRRGKLEILLSPKTAQEARTQTIHAVQNWPALDGEPVMEILSSDQIRAYEPHVAAGSMEAQLCRWSAQVNVDQLLAGLIAACRRAGVKIIENTSVTGLNTHDGKIHGVYTTIQPISAGSVLLCAGIGTGRIEPALDISAPIKPVKGQALLLHTGKPVIGRIVKNGAIFLVPWPDGRILVGSTTEPDAGEDLSNTAEGIEFLLGGSVRTCPVLAGAKIEKIWAGLRPTGPSHRPLMGEIPGMQKLFICSGHFKIGIGMAPLAGQIMAELITTGKTAADLSELTPAPWNLSSGTA